MGQLCRFDGRICAAKITGLLISYVMLKKLVGQNSVLVTTLRPQCDAGCPLLDGGFTDNGPITPVLSATSRMPENIIPRHVSLLGPANTMESIKYLLGDGALGIWTGSGMNLCPFTQVTICNMVTTVRELVVPMLPYDAFNQYNSIGSHYKVFRPDQQVMEPFCSDPLSFDHFHGMCTGDSFCHMGMTAVPGVSTDVMFTANPQLFLLSMIWLRPTKLAARFVEKYVPNAVVGMKYYANMVNWFPDFVAIAPQKGGIGFTKIAGHSILDYLTYLVERLIDVEVNMLILSHDMWTGSLPTCGYSVFRAARSMVDNTPIE